MAQNITLMGASYSDVPAVTLPKTGGGSALFTDVTDTTAIANDGAQGKYFYLADGTKAEGTSTGGGLVAISAAYTQSSSVYDVDSLDSLKSNLVVTALYSDSSTETVPSTDYILSGTLTGGTSTITVTYGDKTDTFDVEVSAVVWLFKEGDECTTLTGGYEKKGFITNAYRLSYGNDGQELQFILRSTASTVTAGTLTTVNKISLSDYKSACTDFDSERFDTSTAFRFYVSESVTDKTDYTAFGSPNDYTLLQDSSVIGVPMGRQVKEFELSSTVTASSKYMSAMIRSYQSSPTGAYLRIYNIYLKPKDNISDADALSILLGETE